MSFDVFSLRKEFPIFSKLVNNHPLVYLDSAASTLKPKEVVERISQHYLYEASNVHRGVHFLSAQATEEYEDARKTIASFIGAKDSREIIFTKGTTESLNLVVYSFAESVLTEGDEVILTTMEHHANIVPWQILQKKKNFKIKVLPINEKGEISLSDLEKLTSDKTKIISLCYVSNSLGTINPVKEVINLAKKRNIFTVIDAAQAIATLPINVQDLDCDFLAFSSHKIFGPTGIGILYGKEKHLETMPPWQGGGDMISSVSFEGTTFNEVPHKFEAGTPHIAGALGLAQAMKFVSKIGFQNIQAHEQDLLNYGNELLTSIEGLRIFGTSSKKIPIFSFEIKGVHQGDIGAILDQMGVAVRVGYHCTEPLFNFFKKTGSVRASCSIYTTRKDLECLHQSLLKAKDMLL